MPRERSATWNLLSVVVFQQERATLRPCLGFVQECSLMTVTVPCPPWYCPGDAKQEVKRCSYRSHLSCRCTAHSRVRKERSSSAGCTWICRLPCHLYPLQGAAPPTCHASPALMAWGRICQSGAFALQVCVAGFGMGKPQKTASHHSQTSQSCCCAMTYAALHAALWYMPPVVIRPAVLQGPRQLCWLRPEVPCSRTRSTSLRAWVCPASLPSTISTARSASSLHAVSDLLPTTTLVCNASKRQWFSTQPFYHPNL